MFDFASSLYFADLFRYFHMADQLEMTKTFGPPLGNFLLKTNFSIKKYFMVKDLLLDVVGISVLFYHLASTPNNSYFLFHMAANISEGILLIYLPALKIRPVIHLSVII